MQLRMCRRGLTFWPVAGDTVQTFLRRTARWSERVMLEAKVPRWDTALLSTWWRWAAYAARLAREPTQRLAQALARRDSSYRETVRASGDSERRHLGRDFCGATSRRWDDAIQAVCTEHYVYRTLPSQAWQEVAQNKVQWHALEATFVQRGLRGSVVPTPPHGRFVVGKHQSATQHVKYKLVFLFKHLQGQLGMQKRTVRRNEPPWAEDNSQSASIVAAVAVPIVAFGVVFWLKERGMVRSVPANRRPHLPHAARLRLHRPLIPRRGSGGSRKRNGAREEAAPSASGVAMVLEPRSAQQRNKKLREPRRGQHWPMWAKCSPTHWPNLTKHLPSSFDLC